MENYKIGIKLADGSFYPILEEGKPQTQKIELTTVRDDQTTVQLDLYRSSSDNMEDAEYVDTLLVENLLPRPKETPTLNLKIEIDLENVLSASIEDCESGEHSETKVSLVTLDSSERTIVPDFSMIDSESSDNEDSDSFVDEFANNEDIQEDVLASDVSETDDLNLDDFGDVDELLSEEVNSVEENTDFDESELQMNALVQDEPTVDVVTDDVIENDVIEDNLEVENNFITEEPTIAPVDDMPSFEEETETEISDELNEMPDLDDMPSFEEETETEISDELNEMPDLDDMPSFEEETETEISDELGEMPDLDDMPSFEEETGTEISDELNEMPGLDDMPSFEEETETEISDELGEMPDIDIPVENDISESNSFMNDSILGEPNFDDDLTSSDNDFETENSDFSEESFPDFSDIPTTQTDNDESDLDKDDGLFGIGNDYGNIGDDMDIDDDMLESDAFASDIDTSGNLDDSIPSPDLSFSDLYVDTDNDNDCPEKKRCSIPVLICSICAVVCVIALLLIMFLTPSKIKGKEEISSDSIWQKEESLVEEVAPVPVPTEPIVEENKSDILVEEQAKEDEIVIVEAPVVTPKEPEVVPEKLKGVEYKIKWGDTLWDIAGTYYKNPWLYKFIADYNNLENPDYIISGTIITIPPR